ncbi:hypothetical protein L8106_17987 [Lyngbya sp. PCC 8106]|nr:hypothetical protein L8106_17987 [Lyngbya sp. PCC 8106]
MKQPRPYLGAGGIKVAPELMYEAKVQSLLAKISLNAGF